MRKNDCQIVRDLIPLVIDRAASDESRSFVEDHIAACAECKKQYDAMKSEMPENARTAFEKEQKQFVAVIRSVRKRKLKRGLIVVTLALLVCMSAAFGSMLIWDRLYNQYTAEVDNSLYSLTLAKLSDGEIAVTVDGSEMRFNTKPYFYEEFNDAGSRIVYLSYMTTPVHNLSQNTSTYQKWCMTVLNQTPDEIRQGTPEHYSILWRDGDLLPDASEEMETYFALKLSAEYWSLESYPETDEGKAPPSPVRWQELEEARQAVPEWQ